jgi:(4S)-4-hydroxy-5-phosphonooxypentane-2,3-dione isomerase
MTFVVVARWVAREGEEAAVEAALDKLLEHSRAESGCRFYEPTRDRKDSSVFVLFEIYDNEAAYRAHLESEHFKRYAIEDAIPRLESREREFY